MGPPALRNFIDSEKILIKFVTPISNKILNLS